MAGIPKIAEIDHIIDRLINRNNIEHEIITSSQVMFLTIYHIHLLINGFLLKMAFSAFSNDGGMRRSQFICFWEVEQHVPKNSLSCILEFMLLIRGKIISKRTVSIMEVLGGRMV